jgi:2-keto-4-pentenoate hydratase/2-oxohepta-3-ene-1,7-dioic acid hydratase in catechol pathway
MQNIVSRRAYMDQTITNKGIITVKEAGRSPPPFPFIFFKPVTCVADHNADVIIPKIAQDDQADYEGELVCSTMKYKP